MPCHGNLIRKLQVNDFITRITKDGASFDGKEDLTVDLRIVTILLQIESDPLTLCSNKQNATKVPNSLQDEQRTTNGAAKNNGQLIVRV